MLLIIRILISLYFCLLFVVLYFHYVHIRILHVVCTKWRCLCLERPQLQELHPHSSAGNSGFHQGYLRLIDGSTDAICDLYKHRLTQLYSSSH